MRFFKGIPTMAQSQLFAISKHSLLTELPPSARCHPDEDLIPVRSLSGAVMQP